MSNVKAIYIRRDDILAGLLGALQLGGDPATLQALATIYDIAAEYEAAAKRHCELRRPAPSLVQGW